MGRGKGCGDRRLTGKRVLVGALRCIWATVAWSTSEWQDTVETEAETIAET